MERDDVTIEQLVRAARSGGPRAVVAEVVRSVRRVTGTEVAFGAVGEVPGACRIDPVERLRDPRWRGQEIRPGRGLGGRVLSDGAARVCADYAADRTISDDFRPMAADEGLRAVACVPLIGPAGPEGLVYVADRRPGTIEDRIVQRVQDAVDTAAGSLAIVRMEQAVGALTPAARGAAARCASQRLRRYVEPAGTPDVRLTPREHDVLELLCGGRSNDAIARELCISPATAKGHVANLLAKFGATSRLEVAANAWRAR